MQDKILVQNHCCAAAPCLHLEEIVFEEVSHGFVGRDGPPGVEIEVEDVEPGHQHQGGQLRLVADSDEDHQQGADKVLDDLEK